MNEYTDLQVIECSRLHSEEAKGKNNENTSLWTNNLQDIVHLNPGDKVSVHGAMVSERGAGQGSSIEIKGQSLGFTKTFNFTTYEEKNASELLVSKYETIECNASSQEIEIRDDTLNFATSYYINANGHNYIHLPRRWWLNQEYENNVDYHWIQADKLESGMSYFIPFKDTFWFYDDYYQMIPDPAEETAGIKRYKTKNNNERYTILMRDATYYSEQSASGNLPPENQRDPENHIYRTFKQLKSITIPAGFNSPQSVATELTRQLQNIKEVKRYQFRDRLRDAVTNASVPGFPINVYDTIETETYKPFNVAFSYYGEAGVTPLDKPFSGIETDFGFYINNGSTDAGTNASGYQWLSQYHVVATKRPELYETGRLCNRFSLSGDTYRGIYGTPQNGAVTANTTFNGLEIGQAYTEENCRRWYEFFKAQELYPEIWNTFSDSRSDYDDGDTIDNSRWIHINRFENASQSYTGTPANNGDAMLGDSGYVLHSWNASNTYQPASAICPIYYKASDRDTFYESPSEDEYSFGCMKENSGQIAFTFTDNNGWGSAFFDMLLEHASIPGILRSRKVGFDMHFSAPGMCYLLPFAGWMTQLHSYSPVTRTNTFGDYHLYSGYIEAGVEIGENNINSQLYRNKLYIGADSPLIDYNGTNFTISGLHTPMNKGNFNVANSAFSASLTTFGDTDPDQEAGDQVYVINPREQWNDWTPARTPYRINRVSGRDINLYKLNDNLEAWTIYDSLCGVFITDINLTEDEWRGTLWDILGFTYRQFNSATNTRLSRINNNNINDLSVITTNAEVDQGDSKIYIQNPWGAPMYNNMVGGGATIVSSGTIEGTIYPEIKQKTQSVSIIADNLPTRMIRGYYTIRSNILQDTPFIGGKINNTTMPIIGIVDKINGDGDFYFGQESSLEFTITKPLRLASLTCSIHDPDGSYAKTSEQNTVLFKIQRDRRVTYDVAQEILAEEQQKQKK